MMMNQPAAANNASPLPRMLSLTRRSLAVNVDGKEYEIEYVVTSCCEFVVHATQYAAALTGITDNASDKVTNVSDRCSVLKHNGRKLEKYEKVLFHL